MPSPNNNKKNKSPKANSPKGKQKGNGNNRNQSNQDARATRSGNPSLRQLSDSGNDMSNDFVTADDRRKTQTKTPQGSPPSVNTSTGQQQTGSTPNVATQQGPTNKTPVVDHVNLPNKNQRVPNPDSRDSSQTEMTGHVARDITDDAQARISKPKTAQKEHLLAHDSRTAQSVPTSDPRYIDGSYDKGSIQEAIHQADVNADIRNRLEQLDSPPRLSNTSVPPSTISMKSTSSKSVFRRTGALRQTVGSAITTAKDSIKNWRRRKDRTTVQNSSSDESGVKPVSLDQAFEFPRYSYNAHGVLVDEDGNPYVETVLPTGGDRVPTEEEKFHFAISSLKGYAAGASNVEIKPITQDASLKHMDNQGSSAKIAPLTTDDQGDSAKAIPPSPTDQHVTDLKTDDADLDAAIALSLEPIDVDVSQLTSTSKGTKNVSFANKLVHQQDTEQLQDAKNSSHDGVRSKSHTVKVNDDEDGYKFRHDVRNLPDYVQLLNS